MKISSQGKYSPARTMVAQVCCILIAVCILGAALWVEWNVYGIAFNSAKGGRELVNFSQRLHVKIPDFMKAIGFTGPTLALSLGMYILIVCGLFLAFLSGKNVTNVPPFMPVPALPWRFTKLVRVIAFIAGAACMTYLLVRVMSHHARQKDVLIWIAAIISFGVVLADRRDERPLPLLSRGEWIWLGIFTVGFAVFYMWHAMWWLYSSLGDEWMFMGHAMEFVLADKLDPFSPLGVDDIMPKFVSYSQAVMMHILGENNFGWRASSAVFAAVCFIPFYYYMKYFFSKTAAVIGTGVMACSHYLIAWATTGKPVNNANIFFCLTFGLYAYFRRFPSRSRCYLYGSFIGLGFYFYTPAKFCLLFIMILYLIDSIKERELRRLRYPLYFLIGFLIVGAPMIFHPDFIKTVVLNLQTTCLKPTVEFGSVTSGLPLMGKVNYVARNTIWLFIAPLYYPWIGASATYRNIMDTLSASLLALGICWSIVWGFRRRQAAALTITFVAALVLIGGTTRYNYPKTTRALCVFPWWAAFAGIGAWRLLELGYSFSLRRRFWEVFCYATLVAVLILNLDQMYRIVPASFDFISTEMLVVREVGYRPSNYHVYYISNVAKGDTGGAMGSYAKYYGYALRFHTIRNEDLFNGYLWGALIKPALLFVDNRNSECNEVLKDIRKCLPGAVESNLTATWGWVSLHMCDFNGEIACKPPAPGEAPPVREAGKIIMDDVYPGFKIVSGKWNSSYTNGCYGKTNHWIGAGGGGLAEAQWNIVIPKTGTYEVFALWTQSLDRARNAPYLIRHADGIDTVRVNQRENGGTWNSLGIFKFSKDQPASITITNDADQCVIADAVKLVPKD
ncbi:MAG: glycosyltransferase family 39 protein [Candidatus Aureabacteria bacterium]|nr:glycosyltransferase family 39 protein [Candidatus Auribacterota bacterium]